MAWRHSSWITPRSASISAGSRVVAAPVVEDEKTAVLNRGALYRHVRYVVYGFLNRGVGVEVAAELHADRFEPVDYALAGEVLGAVEAHVFQEVCGPRWLSSSRIEPTFGQCRSRPALGHFVVTDEIGRPLSSLPVTTAVSTGAGGICWALTAVAKAAGSRKAAMTRRNDFFIS